MGILKFRLNRKNSSGSYDTIHYESSSNIILRPDSTTVENALNSLESITSSHTTSISSHSSSISNLNSEMSSLKSSVSNGKTQVANAITGKGVAASGSDTFATLANKIGQISSEKTHLYIATANSGGGWLFPTLPFVPTRWCAISARNLNEDSTCAGIVMLFDLGVCAYFVEGSSKMGGTTKFTPSDYASTPNDGTVNSSYNPNNYTLGLAYHFSHPGYYFYENDQYYIVVA